ncbi:MAG: metal-dependent hydrolase [Janthinobacterium lividum]
MRSGPFRAGALALPVAVYASPVEPVTHMLTGACIARACGFPARARYATAACVIAAELPDADYVYRLGGPLVYFQHHRGWTHAFWSLPLQAAFVVFLFWLLHRVRQARNMRRTRDEPAPTRWLALGGMALLALCSHILLDWTNNYGVRPFAPWNPHWYAGELVFIVEPVLLLVLLAVLLLPSLLSLVNGEIGMQKKQGNGRGLAMTALLLMVGLWGYRAVQRGNALALLRTQQLQGGALLKSSVDPFPINPYRWHTLAETPLNFQAGTAEVRTGVLETDSQQIYAKPPTTLATLAAKHSWLGQIYLDWSQFPLVIDAGTAAEVHPEMDLSSAERNLHVVQFSDLRFRYDAIGLSGSSKPPLAAEVWIDENRQPVRAFVGDAEQRLR